VVTDPSDKGNLEDFQVLILIGIGANLPSIAYGGPRATCGAAMAALEEAGLSIDARSRWYKSAPQPVSDQPWFVNAVFSVKTHLDPSALMVFLLETEEIFGRQRGKKNAARALDLDLLAYGEMVSHEGPEKGKKGSPLLPHPRLHQRAFVLLPLRDIAPDWRHPVTGGCVDDMIGALEIGQNAEIMADGDGKYGTEWQKNL